MSDIPRIQGANGKVEDLQQDQNQGKRLQTGFTIPSIILGAIAGLFAMFLRADSFGLVRADGNTIMSGIGKFFQATAPSIWVVFVALFLINPILRLFRVKARFNIRQLVIISTMTAIPWGLAAHVMLGSIFPQNAVGWMQAVSGQHVATSHSPTIFMPFLEKASPLVHIQDWDVFERFAVGGYPMAWGAWMLPAITACLFIVAMMWVAVVTAVIIRRRWSEHEHLRYPIGMVTMSMIELKDATITSTNAEARQKSILRNGVFWIGVIIGAFEVSGILKSTIWPWWPIQDRFLTTVSHAWQQNVWLPNEFLRVFGHGANAKIEWLGLMWFVDTRTLFSVVIWSRIILPIFHAICYPMNWFNVRTGVYHAPTLVRTLWGEMNRDTLYLMSHPVFVFTGISCLWLMRSHLKEVFITAFSPKSKKAIDDSEEPISYRVAVITGALAFAYMVIYGVWHQMNVFWSIITMFMYFIVPFLVSSRMRAEFGMPGMDGPSWNITNGFWRRLIGKRNLGDNAIGMAAFTRFGWASHCVWPGVILEGFAMMDRTAQEDSSEKRRLRRSVVYSVLVAIIVGLAVVVFIFLPMINTVGLMHQPRTIQYQSTEWYVYEAAANHSGWRPGEFDFSWSFVYISLVSAFFVFGATWGMSRFTWWPLNPYGLGMIVSSPTNVQTPALWAWAIKSLAMRYGGIQFVHKLNPLMFGAVVGAALMQLFGIVAAFLTI